MSSRGLITQDHDAGDVSLLVSPPYNNVHLLSAINCPNNQRFTAWFLSMGFFTVWSCIQFVCVPEEKLKIDDLERRTWELSSQVKSQELNGQHDVPNARQQKN